MFDVTIWVLLACAAFCLSSVLLYSSSRFATRALQPEIAKAGREGDQGVANIFWVALGLRLGAGLLIAVTGTSDFFAPDRRGYEQLGRIVARHWGGGAFMGSGVAQQVGLYHYYNGTFFYLVGEVAPFVIRALNAFAGAASVLLVYRIAASVFGREAARRAAMFVAVFPSMVLWSALNIRDAWAGMAILAVVWAALRLREGISPSSIAMLLAGLALLGGIRGYMFLLIAAGVVFGYLASLRGSLVRNCLAGMIVALAFLYLYSSLGFGKQMLETASFETLNAQREGMTSGAVSAYYEEIDISTPAKALTFLPVGVTFFLFAPFPWMLSNLRQLITLPEMVAWWYLAFRFLIPGVREGLRVRASHTLTICSVATISIMAYGLVEGNVGTAYRHRAQVLPLLLILAAGGWAAKRGLAIVPVELDRLRSRPVNPV